MLPQKECLNCKFFIKKNYLTRNNSIAQKEYCHKFNQELFSHKACAKFRYTDEIEEEVETIEGSIAGWSGFLMLISAVIFMICLFAEYLLGIIIFGTLSVFCLILLILFMHISNKKEAKIMYGK